MSKLFPSLRSALPAAVAALSLAGGARPALAQTSTVTLQAPTPIGQVRATSVTPYDFTGRVFEVGFAIGSGTLVHRQTVLTAGHVIYEPDTGFATGQIFERGLYENAVISRTTVASYQLLAGYQASAEADAAAGVAAGSESLASVALDQGVLLLQDAPVDDDWANFTYKPEYLTQYPTFILGYPGVSFDGRTMAYIVPSSAYASALGNAYENDDYISEPGMSGGPIYVAVGVGEQYVAASLQGGADDSTGEFNAEFVRAIDKTGRFLIDDAEFTSGYIKRAKITGPKTVQRGTTVAYTVVPVFTTPSAAGNTRDSTNRYDNLKLQSNVPPIQGAPQVRVVKVDNETFNVSFDAGLPANSTTVLQVYFDGTMVAPGKSSLTVTIK